MRRDDHSKKNSDSNGVSLMADEETVIDLEDFGNKARNLQSGPRPIIRHYKANNEGIGNSDPQHIDNSSKDESLSLIQQKEISSVNVDRNDDYQGWLQIKKRKWKSILEKRKKRRLENSKKSDGGNGVLEQMNGTTGRTNISSYFRTNEVALKRSHWQIIQLLQSSHIGQFFAWVVVDGIMLKIPVSVPRVFYLNSRSPVTEEFLGKSVKKTLPHGRQSYNLYEVSIDEVQFREASKKLAALLADPDVEVNILRNI
ncbi:DNA polymerase epsilon catalytic subunit A, variant 3 [Stylosanthes scabra]|nr:DNA polymerase epsilon catalytic subunit A, variant 3 [Stylosanthes scabra]